jgi:EmrB/QacA subfamily drug resistance transporter
MSRNRTWSLAMTAALPLACDRAVAESAEPRRGPDTRAKGRERMVLAVTILASSLAFIDGSVVNVGLPAIGTSLHAGGAGLSWIVNGYLLPLSALLLTGGAMGDRYGRGRILRIGIWLFALASAACAFAPGLGWLVAARVLQGLGAALLMPNSLAILGSTFSGEARGRAVGIWAAVGAAAGALGPLAGGWLIDAVGWQSIFLINLPLAALALFLASRCLGTEAGPARPELDLPGAALASGGLGGLTYGLTLASEQGRIGVAAGVALALGLLLLLAFVLVERRAGEQAMLPLSLFGSHSFIGLNLLTLFLYGALGALVVVLPFALIEAAGYSARAAGAALFPLPVVIAVASPAMGRIAGRTGPRLALTVGPAIVAAGFLLALRISADGSYWSTTLPAVLAIALGMAVAVAPLTTAVLATVEPRYTGVASGVNSAVARAGGLVATALLGAVLSSKGAPLVAGLHVTMLVCAAACVVASLCAFVYLSPSNPAK